MNPKTEITELLRKFLQRCDECNAANGGAACIDCQRALYLIHLFEDPHVVCAYVGDSTPN